MKFLDVEKNYKKKLNGSINSFIVKYVNRYNTLLDSNSLYKKWVRDCIKYIDGKYFYRDMELDHELLDEISIIFEKRFINRISKIDEMYKNTLKDSTEKQIFYANDLYFKIYGIKNNYSLGEYNKVEMDKIIKELKSKFEKVLFQEYLKTQKVISLEVYKLNKI
jgi:hypothetical protein